MGSARLGYDRAIMKSPRSASASPPASTAESVPAPHSFDEATIETALAALGSAERRAQATGYFPTAMRVHGVPVPELRKLAKQVAQSMKDAAPSQVLALAESLAAHGSMEARQLGYELVAMHRGARAALGEASVSRLGKGMDNWASVDAFSVLVAGAAWQKGLVGDALIAGWAGSPDRWWRRAALVSTVPLNMRSRGGRGDAGRTLAICRRLVADRDDMVEKALSWALRELVEREPEATQRFIVEHEAVLGKRVLRELRNKLTTGLKSGLRKPG